MAPDGKAEKAHPQVPNFVKGFLLSALIAAIALGVYYRFGAAGRLTDPGDYIAAKNYPGARDALYGMMNVGDDLMKRGELDRAREVFGRARDLANQARRQIAAENEKEKLTGVNFADIEGEAGYFIAAVLLSQLQRKYLADESAEAPAIPDGELLAVLGEVDRALALKKDKRLYRLKGLVCRLRGYWPSAETALQEAVAMDEKFAEAYNDLGFVYIHLQKFPEAQAAFEKAIIAAENNPNRDAIVGTVNENLGFYHQSLYEHYRQRAASEQDPEWAKAENNRKLAIERYRKSLAIVGDSPAAARINARLAKLVGGP